MAGRSSRELGDVQSSSACGLGDSYEFCCHCERTADLHGGAEFGCSVFQVEDVRRVALVKKVTPQLERVLKYPVPVAADARRLKY